MSSSPDPLVASLGARRRLDALRATGRLDVPVDTTLDDLVALAARAVAAPIAMATLVDHEHQFFAGLHGLPDPWRTARRSPLSHSFCKHVVASAEPLVIEDARTHPLVCDNLATPDMGVVAYLGHPLASPDGTVLGSLAVVDTVPRTWTPHERSLVEGFAAIARRELLAGRDERTTAALLERAGDGFVTIDHAWRLTSANGAAALLLHASPDLLAGRGVTEAFAHAGLDALDLQVRRSAASHAFVEGELRQEVAGTTRWIEYRAHPTPFGVALFLRDVTRSREAEVRLRESEARLSALVAQVPVMVWTTDEALRLTSAHGALVDRVTPTLPGNGIGMSLYDVIGTRDDAAPPIAAHRVALRGGRGSYEVAWGEHVLQVVTVPQQDATGAVTGVVGAGIDVTERTRAAEALRESEARFRSVMEHNPNAVFSFDLAGNFTSANPACEWITGWSPAALAGTSFGPLIAPEDQERAAAIFMAAVAGEVQHWELEIIHRSGRRAMLRGHSIPIRVRGEIVGVQGIAEDVTQRLALEAQLRTAQKMEAVGRLAGGIAHDFNNLLTAIRGYSEMLLEDLEPGDPRRDDAGEIRVAADRAADLTRQLLAFSRRQLVQPRLVAPAAALVELSRLLERVVGEEVALEVRGGEVASAVLIDPGQLEQVVMNLVMNARDAMPSGGRVVIAVQDTVLGADTLAWKVEPGPYVLLSVADTGTGMAAATRAQAFEPFFTTKGPGKGTGLGLATVYGVVKQAGGHVLLDSTPGEGTTVRIYLPSQAPEPAAPTAEVTGRAGAGRTGTVLVVDDEPGVRELARRLLVRLGYEVLAAGGAAEALAVAGAHAGPIDVLLTDVVMPGGGGPELATALCAVRPGTRVVFMSGYTADELTRRGIEERAATFLAKPFSAEALAAIVDTAVAASAASASG